MSEPHVIRLRGPWQFEPVARFVPTASLGDRRQCDCKAVGDCPDFGGARRRWSGQNGTVPLSRPV